MEQQIELQQEGRVLRARAAVASIMGIRRSEFDAIVGHRAEQLSFFQLVSILISSTAFSYAVFCFCNSMLERSVGASLIFAGFAMIVLSLIDYTTFLHCRGRPEAMRFSLAVRWITVPMMVVAAVISATSSLSDDILGLHTREISQLRLTLAQSEQFSPAIDLARKNLARANAAAERRNELVVQIPRTERSYIEKKQAAYDEEFGLKTPGRSGDKGKGTLALSFESEATTLAAQLASMRAEFDSLANAEANLAAAEEKLANIDMKIANEAEYMIGGAGDKVAALITLAFSRVSVFLTVLFFLCINLLADLMIVYALSLNSCEEQFRQINTIQDHRANHKLQVVLQKLREEASRDIRPMTVRLARSVAPPSAAPNDPPQESGYAPPAQGVG